MKKTILIILYIMGSFALTFASEPIEFKQTIRGKVIDSYTLLPLPGANITILNSKPIIGTTTNGEGNFEINDVPVGRVSIEISYVGYQSKTLMNLNLIPQKELNLVVELTEQAVGMQEVVIKSSYNKHESINKMSPVSTRSFLVEETSLYAGSLGDPARMAGNFAGVLAVDDSRNDIIIRGNSPFGLLWRVDGFDIPNPNHFSMPESKGGPMSLLNNNNLSNSDFFTGAFPAKYGNALSGVFDLNLRNGNTYKREHVAQIATSGFELGTEGPIGKNNSSSYIINYRYSAPQVFDVVGLYNESSLPKYQDLNFKLNIPNTKLGYFQLFGLGGSSGILQDSRKQDSTEWTYGLLNTVMNMDNKIGIIGLSHTYYFNENTRIITKISAQGSSNSIVIDTVFNETRAELASKLKSVDTKTTYESMLKSKINNKNLLSFGAKLELGNIDFFSKEYTFNGSMPDYQIDIKNNINLISAFTEYQHKFNNKFTVNLGTRYTSLLFNKTFSIDPRASVKYQLGEKQNLSFGYGIYSQKHNNVVYFLESVDQNGNYIKTNENLDFTKSEHFVLSYNNVLSQNLNLKIETYYQRLWDVPVTHKQPEFSMINSGGAFAIDVKDSLVNEGSGKNYGIELTLEKYLSKNYYFLLTGSLFESKYKGYDGIERNSEFNGNYAFNSLVGYEYKFNNKYSVNFNVRSVYAGGKRKLPIDINSSIASGETEYKWNNAYEEKFKDYSRFDFRFTIGINHKKYREEFAIDIINITDNTSNIINEYFDNRTNKTTNDYQLGRQIIFLWRVYF